MSGLAMRLAVIAAVAALALDGCGSGHAAHSAIPRVSQRARGTVTFTIHWRGTTTGAHRRRPLFISPSAQSVVVEVNSGAAPAGPVTFANAPPANGSPATTTIAIDAPAGQDDFSIALFDQPQTSGETVAVGNQLGRAEVTQTINAGAANVLNAVISGLVASVHVAPAANQPFVETLSAAPPQAYAIVGDQPETFVLTALDPDGNVIVPADTSPAHVDTPVVSLAPSPSNSELAVTPAATDPSRFVVSVIAPKASPGSALALLASATDGAGDRAQTNVSIDERSAVYTSLAGGGASTVGVFDDGGNRIVLPAGAFAGLSNPGAIAYDADDHRVFVADSGAIVAFDASGATVPGYTASQVAGANGVAYDSNDKLLYVSSAGVVSVFTANGAIPSTGPATFVAPHAAGVAFVAGTPPQIAVADANPTAPSFDLFGEDGTPMATLPIGGTAAPNALSFDPSAQAMYVATGAAIVSYALSGSPNASAADANQPVALAFDPNLGELYALDSATGALAAYSADLSSVDAAHGIGALSPGSITKGVAVAF